MVAITLGGVVVSVDNSDPLGAILLDQFDYLSPIETNLVDVKLTFCPGFTQPPDGCVKVRQNLWVNDDQLFIEAKRTRSKLHPLGLLEKAGLQRYQANVRGNPLVEPTEITIYYDEALVRNRGNVLGELQKALDVEYVSPAEQLVRRVLKNLIEPLVHQRLLAIGGGFMRVSAVANEDGAVLFSGWGGVGKSIMSSELLFTHQYAFVGDPLVVVSDEGTVYPYRKRISVTPHSIAAGEATYERLMEGRTWMDRTQWMVRSQLRGLKGARRRALPSTQYSEWDPTRIEVPLKAVVTLVVEDRDTIAVEATSATDVADRAASTIAWQFRGYSDVLLASHAAVPRKWPCVETLEKRSAELYERALGDVDTYLMYVPPESTPEQRVEALFAEILHADTDSGEPLTAN